MGVDVPEYQTTLYFGVSFVRLVIHLPMNFSCSSGVSKVTPLMKVSSWSHFASHGTTSVTCKPRGACCTIVAMVLKVLGILSTSTGDDGVAWTPAAARHSVVTVYKSLL